MIAARNNYVAAVLTGLAIAFLAVPAAAQTSSERSAIHECSTRAAKYKDYAQELDHMYTFRTCMYEHGVPGD